MGLMEFRPQPPGAGCLAMPVRSNQEAYKALDSLCQDVSYFSLISCQAYV